MRNMLPIFALISVCLSCSLDPAPKGEPCPKTDSNSGAKAYVYDGNGRLTELTDGRCPDEEPYCTPFTASHEHSNDYFCHVKCTGGAIPCNGGCKKQSDSDFEEECRNNPTDQPVTGEPQDTQCPYCIAGCDESGKCHCPDNCEGNCDLNTGKCEEANASEKYRDGEYCKDSWECASECCYDNKCSELDKCLGNPGSTEDPNNSNQEPNCTEGSFELDGGYIKICANNEWIDYKCDDNSNSCPPQDLNANYNYEYYCNNSLCMYIEKGVSMPEDDCNYINNCANNEFCNSNNICEPKREPGKECSSAEECISGICEDKICIYDCSKFQSECRDNTALNCSRYAGVMAIHCEQVCIFDADKQKATCSSAETQCDPNDYPAHCDSTNNVGYYCDYGTVRQQNCGDKICIEDKESNQITCDSPATSFCEGYPQCSDDKIIAYNCSEITGKIDETICKSADCLISDFNGITEARCASQIDCSKYPQCGDNDKVEVAYNCNADGELESTPCKNSERCFTTYKTNRAVCTYGDANAKPCYNDDDCDAGEFCFIGNICSKKTDI